MPKLVRRTKNLVIRPLALKDYKVWREGRKAHAPPRNRWDSQIAPDKILTKVNFRKRLAHDKKMRGQDYFYHLAVFDRQTGALVGGISLMEVSRSVAQTCFLGYYIFNSYWGKGLAKEATKAGIDIAFTDLKLHRVEAGIEPQNQRSIRLAKSLKMRKEGLKKRAICLRGGWVDLLMYSLTTEDLGMKWKGKATPMMRQR